MNFERLYTKKEKNCNQREDYLTELTAFMTVMSKSFKEIYLKEFLGLNEIKNIENYTVTTQSRGDGSNVIPDIIISSKKKREPIAICEHKIDSDINHNQNGDQLKSL